jgi:hypothetical protein
LLSSERRFRVQQLPRGGVRFHHCEQAQGIMVPILNAPLAAGQSGLDAMSTMLKRPAERAFASGTVATS